MTDAALRQSWKITETLLERAKLALPAPHKAREKDYAALLAQYREFLDRNELELALDMLEELGDLAPCRGRFWRDLARAAENMGLRERALELDRRFREVLDQASLP
jgi:DNA-binding SARP family transcriptional activator